MHNRVRLHVGILIALFAALLVVVGTLNALVDPYAAHGWIDLESLRPYRVRLISRIAKAELLERERCEVAILGTSRAQIALDPDYAGWDGASVCNLALTGAGLAELEHVYRYALRHDTLRLVLFEVDLFERRAPLEDFALSRFNPDLHPFDYASSLLLGASATRASLRVIRDLYRKRLSPHTYRGLTRLDWAQRRASVRERFIWSLERTIGGRKSSPLEDYDAQGAERVARLVRWGRARGVEVALIILPRHAISLQALRKAGAWPAIERWKRDLVAALDGPDRVEPLVLWDFMSFDGHSAESVPPSLAGLDAKMRWHWDAVHVRPEFGNLVIDRILGGDASNADSLGVRLTTSNLESHLARLERKGRDYPLRHPDELELLREAARPRPSDDLVGVER